MIGLGSHVAFSAQFLRDTAQQTGEAGLLRGEVTALVEGIPSLVEVTWTNCFPQRKQNVNIGNLVEKAKIGAEAANARPGFMQTHKGLS